MYNDANFLVKPKMFKTAILSEVTPAMYLHPKCPQFLLIRVKENVWNVLTSLNPMGTVGKIMEQI